jgi:hypothetical protein
MILNLFLSCVLYLFLTLFLLFCFFVGFADASREEEAVNTINDVLSDLGGADSTAVAEQGAPSVEDCDSIPETLCSLQLSETQSQSDDGTEPVTQPEDVPL